MLDLFFHVWMPEGLRVVKVFVFIVRWLFPELIGAVWSRVK